jgi:hypothetical protein
VAHNGDTVNYFISISNQASTLPLISAIATDVVVTLAAPDATGSPGAPVIIDTIANLNVGDTVNYGPLPATLALNAGVTVAVAESTFSGTLHTAPHSVAQGSKTIPITIATPSIDVTKTVNPTTSKVGDTVIYTVTVTNTGNISLNGIVVTDPLLGVGPLPGFPATLAPLASSGPVNFPYVIPAGSPDPLLNTATVHANPVGLTNDITDSVGPVQVDLVHPSIDITKVANPISGNVGTMITYTITVTNTGDIGLVNIVVTDPLLGVGPLPGFPATLAPLASSGPVNFTRAIQAGDPDPLVNTVTVHANPVGLTNDITDSASATVDITGGEGLTPGFWKNHPDAWEVYTTDQTLESVFDVPDSLGLDTKTLMEALSFKGGPGVGGAAQILLRAAVAALLNSSSSTVDYPLTTAEVISQVNTALASLDRDTMLALATQLDTYNNLGTS